MTGEPDQLAAAHDLTAARIAGALTTRRLGRPSLFFERVGSTNDVVHMHARAGAPEGLLVVADEQTAGRGRLNRSWWAPPGTSLLISLLFRPPLPVSRASQLTMCLGLATAEGIEAVTGLRPSLKWPNDLLLGERKLGGLLAELHTDHDRLVYAVLGLGLNVNLTLNCGTRRPTLPAVAAGTSSPAQEPLDGTGTPPPPQDLASSATSLLLALGRPVDRLTLLADILQRCETWYERLLPPQEESQAGALALHQAWAARLDTLGRAVTATTSAGTLRGVAAGVSREGALLLRGDDGQLQAIWAGDVTTVR